MKKKPAILFLLPVLLLLLTGSGLKAGAADRATTALLTNSGWNWKPTITSRLFSKPNMLS